MKLWKQASIGFAAVFLIIFTILAIWSSRGISVNMARLERILDILEMHPELWWRQRPGLDTIFEGARLITDKNGFRQNPAEKRKPASIPKDESLKIVSLGASPTFGYGVEADETYPMIAQSILGKIKKDLTVINAGRIGYSSLQGLRLLEKYLDFWKPDMLTVSYVVNDIDRLRFFFSNGRDDFRTDSPSTVQSLIVNFISQFWPTKTALRYKSRIAAKLLENRSKRGLYEMAHVRVPREGYEKNMLRFVEICRERKIQLVFIAMPFRLPKPVPPENPEMNALIKSADESFSSGNFSKARRLVDDILKQDPYKSRAYYLHGRLLEAKGEGYKSKKAYRAAVENIIYDCARDAGRYNSIMERVAIGSGIAFVDPTALLGADKANMELFVPGDYIHPNAAGHRRIGSCLAHAIGRILSGESSGFVEKCK